MIIRHLAARTGAIRSSFNGIHLSGRQSSRHVASASVALASPDVDDRPTQHESDSGTTRTPKFKMPAGRDRSLLDARGPATASSSSSSLSNASSSTSAAVTSRRARPSRSATSSKSAGNSKEQLRNRARPSPPSNQASEGSLPPLPSPPSQPQSQPLRLRSTTPEELRDEREKRATQFMEYALSVPVPDPKLYLQQLIEQLESNPSLLSTGSVVALETYALRLNEAQYARRVRNLAIRERLPLPPRQKMGRYRAAKVTTNLWMTKKYPPLALLPEDESKITPYTFLRHQHYLLINSQGHSLKNAIGTLESLKAGPAEKLAALHLALCYSKKPHSLLDEAEEVGVVPFRRQTAHCSVIALLKGRTMTADVQHLMKRFKVRPSPETYRLVALHALQNEDEELARYAWEEGKKALAHERRMASVPMIPRALRLCSSTAGTTPRVTPVFRHLGRHLTRWERVMHGMKDRGWAHRAQFDPETVPKGLPTLAARWFWGPKPTPPTP